MGRRVYIETSVISYLVARPSRNILAAAWQQVTQEWWDKQRARFELFTSELVLAEAAQGDPAAAQRRSEPLQSIPDLEVTDEVVALAKRLVKEGALPREAMDDAVHIAVAAVHGVDYLLTWNCVISTMRRGSLSSGACVLLPDIAVRRFAPRKSLWGNKRMTDEIIQEVWRAKDRLAKEFDYDLDALAAELQKRQKQTGRKIVNLAKDRVKQTAESPPIGTAVKGDALN